MWTLARRYLGEILSSPNLFKSNQLYLFNPAHLIVVYRLHNVDIVYQNESNPACCKIDGFDHLRYTYFVYMKASRYVLSYVHTYVVLVSPISPQIMQMRSIIVMRIITLIRSDYRQHFPRAALIVKITYCEFVVCPVRYIMTDGPNQQTDRYADSPWA